MTASNEQTSLVVKPKQNEYVSFDIYYLRPSHILKQFNNSGYLGMLLFIQLATGTAYLAESATQMAGCWHHWWDTEGATHLLHDLDSIQPRPHPSLSKQLNVQAAKGIHINSWPPMCCAEHFWSHVQKCPHVTDTYLL